MNLRVDQQIISDWIPDGAKVLDLGCGCLLYTSPSPRDRG